MPSIGITVEPGKGLFDVGFDLYQDSLFEEVEDKRSFKVSGSVSYKLPSLA